MILRRSPGRRRHGRGRRPARRRDGFHIVETDASRRARGPGQHRHRDVRRVPGRGRRSRRPALPLPVHELHQLRTPLHDRAPRPVRPTRDDDAGICHVRRVPSRVRRSRRPPLPRAAECVPCVRAAAHVARRRAATSLASGDDALAAAVDALRERRGRRGQGHRRVPPRGRRHERRAPSARSGGARRATTSRSP